MLMMKSASGQSVKHATKILSKIVRLSSLLASFSPLPLHFPPSLLTLCDQLPKLPRVPNSNRQNKPEYSPYKGITLF